MAALTRPARAHSSTVTTEETPVGDQRGLVEQARHDRDAFASLYRQYVRRVYGFAYKRAASREVAEDITAATFERAWRAMPAFTWQGGGFEPWLFRIAANEVAAHFRRQARADSDRARKALRDMAAELAEDEELAGLLRAGDLDERLARLRRGLAVLNPRYQEAISLRYLAGLSADEAAAAMGCSKPVLAVTLHRAIRALRRTMEADGGDV